MEDGTTMKEFHPNAPSSSRSLNPNPSAENAGLEIVEDEDGPMQAIQLALADEENEDSMKRGVDCNEDDDYAPMPPAQTAAFFDDDETQEAKKRPEIIEENYAPPPPQEVLSSIVTKKPKSTVPSVSTESRPNRVTPMEVDEVPPVSIQHQAIPNHVTPMEVDEVPPVSIQHQAILQTRMTPRSVIPSIGSNESAAATTPSVPVHYEVEATVVLNEPVYHGVPIEASDPTPTLRPWWKKHLRFIVGGLMGLVVGLVVAVGVAFGSQDSANSRENADSSTLTSGEPSFQPCQSTHPTSEPSQITHPNLEPSQLTHPTSELFQSHPQKSFLTFEDGNADQAIFSSAAGTFVYPVLNPDGSNVNPSARVAKYTKDQSIEYDWLSFSTLAITDALLFLNGDLLFEMGVFTIDAPINTEIQITLVDSTREGKGCPAGRHSRYVAFTTKAAMWEKLRFAQLDQPDPSVPKDSISNIIMTFASGSFDQNSFYIDNLASVPSAGDSANISEDEDSLALISDEASIRPSQSTHPPSEPSQTTRPTSEPSQSTHPTSEPSQTTHPTSEPSQTAHPTSQPSKTSHPTSLPSQTTYPLKAPSQTTHSTLESSQPHPLESFLTFEDDNADQASFSAAAGTFVYPVLNPNGSNINPSAQVALYTKDQSIQYDWLSFSTSAIADASLFSDGDLIFEMEVFTDDAPIATEIQITLTDSTMSGEGYPAGRHSRYVAFTTKTGMWEKLRFAQLDQPDPSVPNDGISDIIVTFASGSFDQNAFYIDNLVGVPSTKDPAFLRH